MNKIIFCDFDGTLTSPTPTPNSTPSLSPLFSSFSSNSSASELGSSFFDVLNLINEKKWNLVIVSGRPLAWGHFLLTHLPIQAVIMEGGGVLLTRCSVSSKIKEKYFVLEQELINLQEKTLELLTLFPHLKLAEDSSFRRTDRAIDLHDLKRVGKDKITDFLQQNELNYSCSSIHLNYWKGSLSKFKAVDYYLKIHLNKAISASECWFFGDAQNDESMFEFFENSVGVSNIKNDLPFLKHLPRIILEGDDNIGARGVYNFLLKL